MDDDPLAVIYFDQNADPDGPGEWCLSFFLPDNLRTSTEAFVFAGGVPYEATESAVRRVLRDSLGWTLAGRPSAVGSSSGQSRPATSVSWISHRKLRVCVDERV